jgi:hypothetical protein
LKPKLRHQVGFNVKFKAFSLFCEAWQPVWEIIFKLKLIYLVCGFSPCPCFVRRRGGGNEKVSHTAGSDIPSMMLYSLLKWNSELTVLCVLSLLLSLSKNDPQKGKYLCSRIQAATFTHFAKISIFAPGKQKLGDGTKSLWRGPMS